MISGMVCMEASSLVFVIWASAIMVVTVRGKSWTCDLEDATRLSCTELPYRLLQVACMSIDFDMGNEQPSVLKTIWNVHGK